MTDESRRRMEQNIASVMIIILFFTGMITYFFAIIEEGISGAPLYTVLVTLGALLTIAAAFAWSLRSYLSNPRLS